MMPVMGGIERVAWELAEGLGRIGVRSNVLCSNQQRDTVVEHQPSGYDVVRAGSLGMVLSTSVAPAMVAEEMEQLAGALLDGATANRDEACAVLMRGVVQLPDYLERLQNGNRDVPAVLLPLSALTALVVWRHRSNLRDLFAGRERRF